MKKIQILTFTWTENFGALLQAYALQKTLSRLGFYVDFSDYENYKEFHPILSKKKLVVHLIWHKSIRVLLGGNKRKKMTAQFKNQYLNISKNKYDSLDSESVNENRYWAHIVGSDQVWNTAITGNPEMFLFNNIDDCSRKIAYAASFGKPVIDNKYKSIFQRELKNFDAISVREKFGIELIRNLTGLNVKVALDPTLLLDSADWDSISAGRLFEYKYILCYILPSKDQVVMNSLRKISKTLSKKFKIKVIYIGNKEYYKFKIGETNLFDIGPCEFISLFKHATAVVTNSYHGTAFAIKYNLPFFVPVNTEVPKSKLLSSRIESLLNCLELKERILLCDKHGVQLDLHTLSLTIDYTRANTLLNNNIIESLEFLEKALY